MNISIIIPTCNRPHLLIRAIDSVILQKIDDCEIIVVDDGPTDASLKLLTPLIEIGAVRYYSNTQQRSGAAFSRNFGVSVARGEFIAFLDDDDVYMPGRLANMLSTATANDFVFVSSGRFYERNDFQYITNVSRQIFGVVDLASVKYANDIDIGFMMRRRDFNNLGGFDTTFTNLEDWDFVLRMLMVGKGYKLQRLDYAVNCNSDSARVSNCDYIGYRQLAEKHQEYFGWKWFGFMRSMADRREGVLSFGRALEYALGFRSIAPIKIYAVQNLVLLTKLYKIYNVLLNRN